MRRGLSVALFAFPGFAWPFAAPGLSVSVSVLVSLSLSLSGCFESHGTIGAVIAQEPDSGRLFLREVPPGLAAARAGLKTDDEVLLIDGVDVRIMDAKQLHAVLSGEVDAPVKLTVVRDEQVLRVTLRRTEARKLPSKPTN